MRTFGQVTILVMAVLSMGCGPALADKRVALIIGNSAYKNAPRLTNPVNDASRVADTFKAAGFDAVTTKLDLTVGEMRKVLREFGASTRGADIAVIYYAGHGIELDGNNYLIPTDAALETDADVLDETLPLDRVLFAVEPATRLRLIILDACRDNPFARTMKRTIATRAVGRGLAKVEPTSPNTLIAFAAKAGSTASDGDDKGSPFSTALVKHVTTPGLDLRKAFGYVRDDVLLATNNKQEPYVYGSLGGDDVPLVPAKPVAVGPQPTPQSEVRRDYELALQTGDRDAFEAFLRIYPTGFYADLARVQLKRIGAEEAKMAADERARAARQEEERLAGDQAKRAELTKAAAEAKAAEEARLAADKAKQIEAENAAAAERARAAAEQAAAEKLAAEPAATDKADDRKAASLSPIEVNKPEVSASELVKSVQRELQRVGCLTEQADNGWNSASQRSLTMFNRYAGTKFDPKLTSVDVLDAIKAKPSRVCPLVCDQGFRAEGDRCVKVTCRVGYALNDDNECQRVQEKRPLAKQENSRKADTERKKAETASSKPQASGQIYCDQQGCRPLPKGCRTATSTRLGYNPLGGTAVACD